MNASCRLMTPPPAGRGALALIEIRGDVAGVLAAMGIAPVRVGGVSLRSLAGIDEGIVARWSEHTAGLMPHAGPAVVRALMTRLAEAGVGIEEIGAATPVRTAADVEAAMIETLGRAASPLGVDLLLAQPERWSEWFAAGRVVEDSALDAHALMLNRLITPPLVAVIGRSNIGKSTLLNALAGRRISAVADEPGTTRDHVGVEIDCAGVVAHWVDTPGVRDDPDPAELEASRLAAPLVAGAAVVISCCDGAAALLAGPSVGGGRVIRLGLRSDLGPARDAVDLTVAAAGDRATGLDALVALVRERLVPGSALQSPLPWRFW